MVWSFPPVLHKCNRSQEGVPVCPAEGRAETLPGLCQSCSISVTEHLNAMKGRRESWMGGRHCLYETHFSFWETDLVCPHSKGAKWVQDREGSEALG